MRSTRAIGEPTHSDRHYRIAVIPGDGIGVEVVPESLKVIRAASVRHGFTIDCEQFPWGSEYFLEHDEMMPIDGTRVLMEHDAILLGAVGAPDVPDHVSLWGLLMPIRQRFQQYVNLRPVRTFPSIASPLRSATSETLDMVIVRENIEGEYTTIGGRFASGTDSEFATQTAVFSRVTTDKVIRFALELASTRSGRIASATKSNGLMHSMTFWDERFSSVSQTYTELKRSEYHIDALVAHLVTHPEWFDVIVASNLFGDIVSDLAAAVTGGLGLAPSANLNPDRSYPSMFEPVHGSAPDIAGKNVANPIAQIWSAALLLDHLGEATAAESIVKAIELSLASTDTRTQDIGGRASTAEVGTTIEEILNPGLS